MRLRSLLMLCGAALLLLVTGGPSSHAENDTLLTRDPTLQRGRGFFGVAPRPPVAEPRRRVAPVVGQQRRAPAVIVRDDPVIPKVDVSHYVMVFGDSLADLVGGGLEEAFNDRPDVAVIRKARADSGLVRSDFYDWPKAISDLLASNEKISVAVVMLGLNDRQAIREGETVHEPLSERWLQLYRSRIDLIVSAFAERRIPLIWIGAPPMQNARLSADLIRLNDLYRQRAEKAGERYVDLWGPYVDSENRYTAMGPDVTGQTMRLRLGDGVHFTRAGARKAAHFVEVLIRRTIEQSATQNVIALPVSPVTGAPLSPELQAGGIERLIDRMVSGLPELEGLAPALRARPLAGPILPLTGLAAMGESALIASVQDARGRGEVAAQLERVFGEGVPPEPRPGRIDDYRWPKMN